MNIRSTLRNLLALQFAVVSAAGNGGGYAFGLKFSGEAAPFQPEGTEHVQILKEDLTISLGQSSAKVSVRYVMKNVSKQRTKVRFGFPVEEASEYRAPEVISGLLTMPPKCLTDYMVRVDNKPIKYEWLREPFAAGSMKPFPGSEALQDIKGWLVSSLAFGKGEEREVAIDYESPYHVIRSWVSDDSTEAPQMLRYRLSTGGVWHGPILNGTITIKPVGVPASDVVIHKPADRFALQADGSWLWRFDQVEPTLADDIEIEAVPGYSRRRDYSESRDTSLAFLERKGRWHHEHRDYTATASSERASEGELTYGVANVSAPYSPSKIAWVEGVEGPGIGEYLDFSLRKPMPVSGLAIIPGYANVNEVLFKANNRPSKITLTFDQKEDITFSLEDSEKMQILWFPDHLRKSKVEQLRLTIKEVYRGEQFDDTCISGVHFITPLAKKPVLSGAR